jgi:hypothetical protein
MRCRYGTAEKAATACFMRCVYGVTPRRWHSRGGAGLYRPGAAVRGRAAVGSAYRAAQTPVRSSSGVWPVEPAV